MTIKEMREKLGMTQEAFAKEYNIPKRTIENWEYGKRNPPQYVLDMLQKAVDHHISRTPEEVMSLPITVSDLKMMCDILIKEGYGERSILLSNDTEETGYHGMYYGFGNENESDTYITLN